MVLFFGANRLRSSEAIHYRHIAIHEYKLVAPAELLWAAGQRFRVLFDGDYTVLCIING